MGALSVTFSNSPRALARELAAEYATFRRTAGYGVPYCVVVPNRHVGWFALRTLAERTGGLFGVEVLRPFEMTKLFVPDDAVLVTPRHLESLLLHLAEDPPRRDAPALRQIRAYLTPRAEEADDGALRKVQFVRELSRLFLDYARTHPHVCEAWRSGDRGPDGALEFQAALFRAIFGKGGLAESLHSAGRKRLLLPYEVMRSPAPKTDAPFACFLLESYEPAFLSFLATIPNPVSIHAQNPCQEFWEDAPAPRGETLSLFGREEECEPLARWGRFGQAVIRSLCQACNFGFSERYELAAGSSSLSTVQTRVLERQSTAGVAEDPSLELRTFATRRDECDWIASEIEALGQNAVHEAPRLDAIAIVIPEDEEGEYLSHLLLALARHGHPPLRMVERKPETGSVHELAGLLLRLPDAEPSKHILRPIVLHEKLAAHWGASNLDAWGRLFTEIPIPDVPAAYAAHWESWIQSVVTAHFRSEPQTLSLSMARLIRSLLGFSATLRETATTLRAWGDLFADYFSCFLNTAGDTKPLAPLLDSFRETSLADTILSFGVAKGLLVPLLASRMDRAHGDGGLWVGRMGTLCGMPFHTVFMLGVTESGYPAARRRPPLDARVDPQWFTPTDELALPAHQFLTMLTTTEQRLVLSCPDPHLGSPPSPFFLDLARLLTGSPAKRETREAPAPAARPRAAIPSVPRPLPTELPPRALVRFLECPLQGHAEYVLRVSLAPSLPEKANLELQAGLESRLLEQVYVAAARGASWDLAYKEATRTSSDFVTASTLGEEQARRHLALFRDWHSVVQATFPEGPLQSRLGLASLVSEGSFVVPPLLLGDRAGAHASLPRLAGSTGILFAQGRVLFSARSAPTRERVFRGVLRAWVLDALLFLSGAPLSRERQLLVLSSDAPRVELYVLPDEARLVAWARSLLHALTSGPHDYFLPCEAVLSAKKLNEAPAKVLERMQSHGETFSSAWGPVSHPEHAPVLAEPMLSKVISDRYALFFDSWKGAT